jgi:hypothetical protein
MARKRPGKICRSAAVSPLRQAGSSTGSAQFINNISSLCL